MNSTLGPRGSKDSPIIIVGDSLPSKENTRNNLREILDRRHIIYNSIIVPIKYYVNEYLLDEYQGYKLPKENKNDIFRYINAIEDSSQKSSIDCGKSIDTNLYALQKELISNSGKSNYKIIICLGDFAYFAVRAVFGEYNGYEQHRYGSSGKYSIEQLGEYFADNIKIAKKKLNNDNFDKVILPILHNSSNLSFENTDKFIKVKEKQKYVSYLQYIGENIGELLWIIAKKEDKVEAYLKKVNH